MPVQQGEWQSQRNLPSLVVALALSSNEILINMLQLAIIITMIGLVRIQCIGNWSARLFRCFPYSFMVDYERLSIIDWIVHYITPAYNIGVMQRLLTMSDDGEGEVSLKRRYFAIVVSGLGHVLGTSLMISHSLIGTGSPAQQAFHNFSAFLMKFSAMSIGGFMFLPIVGGLIFSSLVTFSIMRGLVSFQNILGIILTNFGLLAILTSSKRDFPVKFKIGYTLMSFSPLIVTILDGTLGKGTDLAHTLGALSISLSMIIQRWSLI